MRIGVPKEIKTQEFRVGMTPAGVQILTSRGHEVLVEQGAGLGSSIPDDHYVKAGARIVATRDEVWGEADMVVKVKEPIAPEFPLMRRGQLLFTYLHLAAAQELGHELLKRGVDGIAYETIEPTPGDLPLLTPMSAVAGRMAVQAGATYLERERGGKGVLLGGVPGVKRGRVTVIGGGVVGQNAVKMALAMQESFAPLRAAWKKRGFELDLGIGIAQGYATLGAIGFEGRWDYACIGSVTNLAARLCSDARGGQILINQKTLSRIEDAVEAVPLGEVTLKGIAQPVPVFNITGLKA